MVQAAQVEPTTLAAAAGVMVVLVKQPMPRICSAAAVAATGRTRPTLAVVMLCMAAAGVEAAPAVATRPPAGSPSLVEMAVAALAVGLPGPHPVVAVPAPALRWVKLAGQAPAAR